MGATNGRPGPLRVVVYGRVSTDKQVEKYGLDAQVHALTRRAAERGYEVVPDGESPVFADDGYSGGDLHRPALNRLRQAVRAGRADIVLAYDPDRISRNLKDLLLLADEFERAGVRLECMTQEVDASPEGQMFFAIRGAVAQYEKAKIRERTARGRKEKAEQGKVVLPRNLPCWLRSDDGGATVYVDEKHWAPIVRRAFALFLGGEKLSAIARQFEAEGIAPPGAGRNWRSGTIHDWLRSPAAQGTYQQFVTETVPSRTPGKSSRKRRDAEPWAVVAVPGLVDAATWAAVQERLKRNQAFASRNAKRLYLLTGLVRCGRCGARLAGAHSKGYRYYRCTHRGTRYGDGPIPPEARCDAPWTQADWLEQAVWDRIASLFRDPERLQAELEQRKAEGSPTRTAAEQELAGLRARLGSIPREQDRLLGAFAKGHVPEDALARQMDGLQKERLSAQKRAVDLERDLAALALSEKQAADAVDYAASIAAGLDGLDDEGRKRFLQDMVREVRVDGRRVTIRTILHGGPGGGGSGGGGLLALRPVQQDGPNAIPLRPGRGGGGGPARVRTLEARFVTVTQGSGRKRALCPRARPAPGPRPAAPPRRDTGPSTPARAAASAPKHRTRSGMSCRASEAFIKSQITVSVRAPTLSRPRPRDSDHDLVPAAGRQGEHRRIGGGHRRYRGCVPDRDDVIR